MKPRRTGFYRTRQHKTQQIHCPETAGLLRPHPGKTAATTPGDPPAKPKTAQRHRWYLVQADTDNLDEPVVVLGKPFKTREAADRYLTRSRTRRAPGARYAIRPAEDIRRRLEWDEQTKRGVTRPGPPD